MLGYWNLEAGKQANLLLHKAQLAMIVIPSFRPSVCSLYYPQFRADQRETWYEASLGRWAEQGQVGDARRPLQVRVVPM